MVGRPSSLPLQVPIPFYELQGRVVIVAGVVDVAFIIPRYKTD
jgi:hypothetical protein